MAAEYTVSADYLIIDGIEIWGSDHQPIHKPPEHMHEGTSHGQPAGWRHNLEEGWPKSMGEGLSRGRARDVKALTERRLHWTYA